MERHADLSISTCLKWRWAAYPNLGYSKNSETCTGTVLLTLSSARLADYQTEMETVFTRPSREFPSLLTCSPATKRTRRFILKEKSLASALIMSSFSMRGESGSNVSLLKGQPKIPPNCKIAEHQTLPQFGQEYRTLRASGLSNEIFSCEYEIIPQHDINGVGLLYFAAYPIISDICEARFVSQRNLSTIKRDVFYFSNCDPGETLVFRIHSRKESVSLFESESSISRKSDGVLMARIFTTREIIK